MLFDFGMTINKTSSRGDSLLEKKAKETYVPNSIGVCLCQLS